MHGLDAFFATVKLPSISKVTQALIKTLNDEDAGISEVSHIIAQDPALVAKLLRLANSAQFGLPRSVGTLNDAIQLVGMSKVRSVALGASLSESIAPLPGLNMHEFWAHSLASAGYAQWLATGLRIDAQQAWLTGRMLRLGELLMGQTNPQTLLEIEMSPRTPGSRWSRQRRLVGFAEGQITAELARRWNFPLQFAQALERSYDPLVEPEFSQLGAVIHLAGLLADMPDADASAVDVLPPEVISALGLDVRWMKVTFPAANTFISFN